MITLAAGSAEVTVDPDHGARLTSLRIDGLELLVGPPERPPDRPPERPRGGGDPSSWGCFPMAPYAGRVRHGRLEWDGVVYQLPLTHPPHAIHGTVFASPWDDLGHDSATARLAADLGPAWPFAGRAVHHVRLHDDRLELALTVESREQPFPAWCGWHPWFRRRLDRGEEAALAFTAGSMYERDAEGIPTGALVPPLPGPWDDCFTALDDPRAVLTWPGALELTVESDADHLVVYDQPADALCVEPQTAPPDAVALGRAAVVEPGRPLSATATFRWRLKPTSRT